MARLVPPWLPNAISFLRVLLVPVWVLCAETANRTAEAGTDAADGRWCAASVLLTIGLSDVLDGWLARHFGLQSRLGASLDAIADKLAQVVLFTYLTLRDGPAFAAVPAWFLALLIGRDALLLAGYLVIRRRRVVVDTEHRLHGRVSSLLLFMLLVAVSAGAPAWARTTLLHCAAVVLAISTALYARRGAGQLRAR